MFDLLINMDMLLLKITVTWFQKTTRSESETEALG